MMVQRLNYLDESASQTAGPYVHIGCAPNSCGLTGMYGGRDLGSTMTDEHTNGERLTVLGRIFDGTGTPLRDALVEIWQADHSGLFNSPNETRGDADTHFTCWGRQAVDTDTGEFKFETIRPGQVPYLDGRMQAPHIHFWIAARGINLGLHTRMYFSDEPEANKSDPVLSRIEHKSRIATLMAEVEDGTCRFNVHLQGSLETIFFDI